MADERKTIPISDLLPEHRIKAAEILAQKLMSSSDQMMIAIERILLAREDNHLVWMQIQCDGCGEAWCAIHQEHYSSCPCTTIHEALDAFYAADGDPFSNQPESEAPPHQPIIVRTTLKPISCPSCGEPVIQLKLYDEKWEADSNG